MTGPITHLGVIVPARDEEALIALTLASIDAAAARLENIAVHTIVVCDRCIDQTALRARTSLKGSGSVLETSAGSVGEARRIGVAALLAHWPHIPSHQLWIANTDADTTVSPDWLGVQANLAAQGFVGVAGTVQIEAIDGHLQEARQAFSRHYRINADGTHGHVHGANLGVRADAYLSAGGWSPAALAEDHCLWSRLKRSGLPLFATSRLVVTTSGRLSSRVAGGFADTLNLWWKAQRLGVA